MRSTSLADLTSFSNHQLHHDNYWVKGYLQETSALLPHKVVLAEELQRALDKVISPELAPKLGESYAVAHVRRGDYASVPRNLERLGVCAPSYYEAGFSLLKSQSERLIIVSDDPKWAYENVAILWPWPEKVEVSRSSSQFDDFALIAHSSAAILANSTYSWWAAFVGSPTKIISPFPWFDMDGDQGPALEDWVLLNKRTGDLVTN
ncbi:hypothetical protein Kisp02_32140 [Kineosporia sp. NBRC 101731]|nr:hypothetical protein Kisp02_32140 [Kineosporia sp. NBRC 101731]